MPKPIMLIVVIILLGFSLHTIYKMVRNKNEKEVSSPFNLALLIIVSAFFIVMLIR